MLVDRAFSRACALVALAAFSATAFADPGMQRFQMRRTLIEAPNGTQTHATDVNNAGVVIGIYNSPQASAYAWTREGGFVDLEGALESGFALPRAVNECGQIVGEMANRAVLWNTFDEVQDLGTLGGDISVATAINDRGDVAGYTRFIPGGRVTPFLWTETEGMRSILECDGESATATGINNSREIVGVCDERTGSKAFYWSEATGRVDFPRAGFASTSAVAINDRGEVTGTASVNTPEYTVRTFKWTPRNQRVVFLRRQGEFFDVADDINRWGWVAGAAVEPGEFRRAMVWLTPRLAVPIDPGLGTSASAYGLNDVGSVAGTIDLGNRNFRAALWEPPGKVARALKKHRIGRCLRPG